MSAELPEPLATAYDPAAFQACAAEIMSALTGYLQRAVAEPDPCLPYRPPAELIAEAERLLAGGVRQRPLPQRCAALAEAFLSRCNRLHSPRYIGHQVPAAVPIAGLFDALGGIVNQPMSVYEMGPFALAAEKALVRELGQRIGWRPGDFDGFVTHGGSLSNFTALLAARNHRFPEVWRQGLASLACRPAFVVSADSHYSVNRAAGMLGLGAEQAIKAPLDARRRLDVGRLADTLHEARVRGLEVFAVVAAAGATPTGSYDDLAAIADLCRERGVWLHVDGAHGASALLSAKHRGLLRGLDQADSVTWDAHKMLFVPALCTFTLFRDARRSYAGFEQDAPYLFDPEAPGQAEYDVGIRTVECTKRSAALGLWGVWSVFGPDLFGALVERVFAVCRQAHALLADSPDFIPCHEPQSNILCFRHLPAALRDAPPAAVSDFQARLRRRLVEDGSFYITSTRLDGVMALRITVMNPRTGSGEILALMDKLRAVGAELVPC